MNSIAIRIYSCALLLLLLLLYLPAIPAYGSGNSPAHKTFRSPFPEGVPIEHFSYFNYPTDVLGFMDAAEGAEITPEGYIYTGYTELIFLHGPNHDYFPPRKHYWLEKEYIPIHHWEQRENDIGYRFSAVAEPVDQKPENNLLIYIKIIVTNHAAQPRTGTIALAIRYAPPESEGDGRYAPFRHRFRRPERPIRPGLYRQAGENFKRRWMFRFRDNQLLRKEKVLYSYSGAVNPDLFSYRGYPVAADKSFRQPSQPSSPVGISRFSKHLAPGGSFEIIVKMPYTPILPDSPDAKHMNAADFPETVKRVSQFWDRLLSKGMQVDLPEKKAVHVYNTSLIYDLIARDKITEKGETHYIQTVNEFHYDEFWLRDSAYIVRSYDLGGYHDIARQCMDFFFRWQREDGNFLSQGGQFDGWGQTLWAFGQHYRLTGDSAFARKCLPAVMKAAQWLESQMEKDPLGIIPQSTPGDNENIEGGHVTGHNIWALAGLKNAVLLAEGLGNEDEARTLRELRRKLRRNFLRALRKVLKTTGNYIPPGMDKPGGQDWGNLMAVYPEEILPPEHRAVTETLKRSTEKYREKIMTYADTKYLHHYLTMKNTETRVVRGEQEAVLDEFYGILAHTSSTQAGFEFSITPWSDRDFRANLTPHGWFAAKYRNLLRSMLVRERSDTLHLMSVMSPAWAGNGKHIRVTDSPTYFGTVSFTARFHVQGVDITLKPRFSRSPENIAIHIPYFARFMNSNVGKLRTGSTGTMLMIPPETRTVNIRWERKPGAAYYSFEKTVNWLKREYNKSVVSGKEELPK